MLGGRYSPQVVEWVNWSASPRAYHVSLAKDRAYLLKKSYLRIIVRCDGASCHIVSLLHKRGAC